MSVNIVTPVNFASDTLHVLKAGDTMTGALTVDRGAIGTTSTDGVVLQNLTAAAQNLQQISPRIRFTGQGWKNNTVSRTVDFMQEMLPIQGTGGNEPTPSLNFKYQINGGGYLPGLTLAPDTTLGAKVGIGTTSPNCILHLVGATTPFIRLESQASTGHILNMSVEDGSGVVGLSSNGNAGAFPFAFKQNGAEVARFSTTGLAVKTTNLYGLFQVGNDNVSSGLIYFGVIDAFAAGGLAYVADGSMLVLGANTNSYSDTLLEMHSTEKGALLPRMTTAQRDAIGSGSPTTGLVIFNSDQEKYNYAKSTGWHTLGGDSFSVFEHYADGGNVSTSETDLYSNDISTILTETAQKLVADYGGIFVNSATATRQIRVYVGSTVIFDTGAISIGVGNDAWTVKVLLIVEDFSTPSAAVVRCIVSATTTGATTNAYTQYTSLTDDFTRSLNLKITGQAAGVGAATNDIVAKIGSGQRWDPS